MQKVDGDALEPGTVYAIFEKRETPANGVYMTGTFSESYDVSPLIRGIAAFKNVTIQGRQHESIAFVKANQDFYLVEPKPPLTGGRQRKRRTHRRNGKKHVLRRRRVTRKH